MRALRLTTPQEHLVHHSADLEGNYGNFTTLWDRAFGTYLDPTLGDNQNHPLGLPYDQDFLGTLTFGRYKLPEPVRQRFQVARYCNVHRPADRRGDGVRRDAGEDGRATEAIVR
jgi:hypothetical protein